MMGLIEEGEEVMAEGKKRDDAAADLSLIGAAQRVEHYEIAGYGCARAFARRLGRESVARLLQETLDEEAKADRLLTQLAENIINPQAAAATKRK